MEPKEGAYLQVPRAGSQDDLADESSRPLVDSGPAQERQPEMQHYMSAGHVGEVLNVDASDEMDFIITGGIDGTMRVWQYGEHSETYQLTAVLVHDDAEG